MNQLAARLARIEALVAALAAARTVDEVTSVILDAAVRALGANVASLWIREGAVVRCLAARGIDDIVDEIRTMPLADDNTVSRVVMTGEPLWLSTREEYVAAFPTLAKRFASVRERSQSVAVAPLELAGAVTGAIGFAFEQARALSEHERADVLLIAKHASIALGRARVVESEQRARHGQELLAEASKMMSGSLDYQATLERIASMSVPVLADFCTVLMRAGDGGFERLTTAHRDRLLAPLVAPMTERVPPGVIKDPALLRTVEHGEAVLVANMTDEHYVALADGEAQLAAVRALKPRSYICAPLVVGARPVGAIVFSSRRRSYDEDDLQIARELAQRASLAIENARLYAVQERLTRRLAKLQEATAAFARALTPEHVARVAVELGRDAADAQSAAVWLLESDGSLRRLAGAQLTERFEEAYAHIPAGSPLPAAQVIRTGEPVWVEGEEGLAVLPLMARQRPIGAVAFMFPTARHEFPPEERDFLRSVIGVCEQALERSLLFAAEAAARRDAEAASRAKDEFLAMLGHELRNPLAPIVTALELLKLRSPGVLPRESAIIDRHVQHLTHLVDDLLDISRITRGIIELRREVSDVHELIAQSVESASPLIEARRQHLQLDVPTGLRVLVDRARFVQVISNLLTNAARYTPAGGRIDVSARQSNGWIDVIVRDSGRGIPAELLPRLFDPFVQGARGIDRREGGLGLGLAIVKNLVELHGGTVDITSDGPNLGTIARVRWRRAQTGAVSQVGAPAAAGTDKPLRVLVVDDNVETADLLGDMLRLMGHDPVVVYDGPAALESVVKQPPQVAFVDITLPVIDGYELARRLRTLPRLEQIRLVALTGYAQPQDAQRAEAAGFEHHLVKPIEVEAVHRVLQPLTEPDGD